MIVITVARKPVAESTVAGNILTHGCGALNIDGTRVGTAEVLKGGAGGLLSHVRDNKPLPGMEVSAGTEPWAPNTAGRWPANVIFEHKPGCEQTGTRKVKSGVAGTAVRGFSTEYVGGEARDWKQGVGATYGAPDGTEEIPAWNCAEGCPVADLDRQSGHLHGSGNQSEQGHGKNDAYAASSYMVTYKGRALRDFGDSEGASRFFKCFHPSK